MFCPLIVRLTMRFPNAILVAAIAFYNIGILPCTTFAESLSQRNDYTGSVLQTLPPSDMVQVIVMHKNGDGKAEVEKVAQRLVGEIPRFNILVVTMMVHNVDGLRHSPNIHGVDLDKAVKVTPKPLEEFDDHDLVRRRAMKEEVSNGVNMVQARRSTSRTRCSQDLCGRLGIQSWSRGLAKGTVCCKWDRQ